MSEEDPMVDGQPLSSLRVVDLREALDKHGLSKSGNKKDLADRLREFLLNGTIEASPTKSVAGLRSPTKSPENSLVAAYKARQAAALNKASEERERVRRESENEVSKMETPKKVHPQSDEASPNVNSQLPEDNNKEVQESQTVARGSESPASEVADRKESEPRDTRSESPAKDANESGMETKENSNADDDIKEKSLSPDNKETSNERSDTKKEPVQIETENDDHVELDYGDGDVEESTAEEDTKSGSPKEKTMTESVSTSSVTKSKRIEAPAADDSVRDAHTSSNGKTRNVSPSRYPASEILHIRGLMRPFTIPLLKNEICKAGGEIVDFWIDNIRSHCFVKMRSVNEATTIRNSLHGIHWPISNPKSLVVQFDTLENMDRHKSGEGAAPVSASRTISVESHEAKGERIERSERRERPTLAPLAGRNGLKVTLETMVRDNNKKEEEERERREKEGKEKAKEIEKKMKDKELREKEERENRKRQRSETPPHSRTEIKREKRESPERKERRRNDSELRKEEKVEPEKPVKTADEYFKKTVAQPSIYYLPLSEEEAVARMTKKDRQR